MTQNKSVVSLCWKEEMKLLKWILVYIIVAPVFYIMTFPICSLIALMDWGNGKTYKENLREVMGMKQK